MPLITIPLFLAMLVSVSIFAGGGYLLWGWW